MSQGEINPNVVYTTKEAEVLLKVSRSTLKRLLKKGLIKANKVGRQYRILGLELLRLISPRMEKRASQSYLKVKKRIFDKINKW